MGVEIIAGNPFPENLLFLWERLLSQSSFQNPFLTPIWSRLWLLHFGRNLEVKTLLCRSSAADPIGLGVFPDSKKEGGKRGLNLLGSLVADCIRRATERGMAVFHFLRGQEGYKSRLAGQEEKIYQIQAVKG